MRPSSLSLKRRPSGRRFLFKTFLTRRGAPRRMLDPLALAIFVALLVYAAGSDIASLTISNWVSIALASAYPILALASGQSLPDVGLHLLFGFGVLAAGFVLFQMNIIGGGDAKLFAAVSVWTGIAEFRTFILGAAMIGGLLALALVAARQFIPQTEAYPGFVNQLLKKQNGIPYGVAILGGGLLALPRLSFAEGLLTLP